MLSGRRTSALCYFRDGTAGCDGEPQPADNDVDSSDPLLTPSLLDENRYRSGGVSQQQSGRALDEGGRNRRKSQA